MSGRLPSFLLASFCLVMELIVEATRVLMVDSSLFAEDVLHALAALIVLNVEILLEVEVLDALLDMLLSDLFEIQVVHEENEAASSSSLLVRLAQLCEYNIPLQ